jgi:hypothetical protein
MAVRHLFVLYTSLLTLSVLQTTTMTTSMAVRHLFVLYTCH